MSHQLRGDGQGRDRSCGAGGAGSTHERTMQESYKKYRDDEGKRAQERERGKGPRGVTRTTSAARRWRGARKGIYMARRRGEREKEKTRASATPGNRDEHVLRRGGAERPTPASRSTPPTLTLHGSGEPARTCRRAEKASILPRTKRRGTRRPRSRRPGRRGSLCSRRPRRSTHNRRTSRGPLSCRGTRTRRRRA